MRSMCRQGISPAANTDADLRSMSDRQRIDIADQRAVPSANLFSGNRLAPDRAPSNFASATDWWWAG